MKLKKFILFFLFLVVGCAHAQEPVKRALFVSMIQDPQVLESKEEIRRLIDFSKKAQIKILFVQIYRANQTWFPSTLADSRLYEKAFKNISQDPFALLIEEAHKEKIEVHAWLNLLSLSANKDANILKKYGPDILTRNLERKQTIKDYKIDNQYFLEPSDRRVWADLGALVEEILQRYPVLDGLSFDYIRYPDVEPYYGYSADNMQRFMKAADVKVIDENSALWKNWKRQQVTELLMMLTLKARLLNSKIQISTTGCMPFSRAYHEAFQDWISWVDSGLIDFVTVMNYSDNPQEFAQWNQSIKGKVKDFAKVKIGVGAYKFVQSPQGFKEEFHYCQGYGTTCAVFHYGSVLENSALQKVLFEKYSRHP